MDPNKIAVVQPELYRVPGTANIIIKNCDGILYLSTNFGKLSLIKENVNICLCDKKL